MFFGSLFMVVVVKCRVWIYCRICRIFWWSVCILFILFFGCEVGVEVVGVRVCGDVRVY